MTINFRTDLAVEAHEYVATQNPQGINGVDVQDQNFQDHFVKRVEITTPGASQQMGKQMGRYITLEMPDFRKKNTEFEERVSQTFAQQLNSMLPPSPNQNVLIVGLGNWNVTPDALGPKVIDRLLITRHLKSMMPERFSNNDYQTVSALAPGVLGLTGIETSEVIEGVVRQTQPDYIIAIDALAARDVSRLNTTIQISDTGIHPGSGVGNKRKGITREDLGVDVIAIGVPTVVDAVTVTSDTIEMVTNTVAQNSQGGQGGQFYQALNSLDGQQKEQLIAEVLNQNLGSLIVTPKEIDRLIEDISDVVAGGINAALHPVIDYQDATKHLY
ncbi:GPR endopeptidase [Proteinivorax hydrogeniformans]|uniref:Germination protease n=1 Tax=Proteinivorax hydrogeniformans TaxID=1826727 RepID=A0AAU8HWN9_9FIRM